MHRNDLAFTTMFVVIAVVSLNGCGYLARLNAPLSPQEALIIDVWPVLNDAQRKEIRGLSSLEEMQKYLDDFWKAWDPTPNSATNEYRSEYEARLEYVHIHYPYKKGWTFEDRARVYLIYGPPDDLYFDSWMREGNCGVSEINALEIWVYDLRIDAHGPETLFDYIDPNRMKFVFADLAYAGRYTQIYSNVPGEYVNPNLYLSPRELIRPAQPMLNPLLEELWGN